MSITRWKAWILAARPKTLVASIVPVFLGAVLAGTVGAFKMVPFVALLVAAMLIQIASNFSNDVADFEKGTDNELRVGPTRAVQAGWIAPTTMKLATAGTLFTVFLIGIYLVYVGGLPIFVIGVFSLFFAWGYTSGPFPLAYLGLGEIFVLMFFGPIAVGGTYYIFTGAVSQESLLLGVCTGLIASAILVVNNLRDIDNDRTSGKNTLAVRFGQRFARMEYVSFLLLAGFLPLVAFVTPSIPNSAASASLYAFTAIPRIRAVFSLNGAALNPELGRTAKLLVFFSFFVVLGKLT